VILKEGKSLSEVVAVGDSITDFKMLDAVRENKGTAVVFNGNKFALPYGNVSLACSSMTPLLIVLDAFASGGTEKVLEVVKFWQEEALEFLENPAGISRDVIPNDVREFLAEKKFDKKFLRPDLSILLDLSEEDKQRLIEIHSKARKYVRGEASKLG